MRNQNSITEYLRECGRVFFSYSFLSNLLIAIGIITNVYLIIIIISYILSVQKIVYYFILFCNLSAFIPLLLINLYKDWFKEIIRDIDIKNSIETYFQVYINNDMKAKLIKKNIAMQLYSKQSRIKYTIPKFAIILGIIIVILLIFSLSFSYIVFNKAYISYVNPEQRASLIYKKLLDSKFDALGIDNNREIYDINQQYDALSQQLQKGEIDQEEFQAYIDNLLEHLDKNTDAANGKKPEISEIKSKEEENMNSATKGIAENKTKPSLENVMDFLQNKLKRDDTESENSNSSGVGKTNTGKSLIDSPLKDFKSYISQLFTKDDKGKVKSTDSFTEEQKQALFSLYFSDYVETYPLTEYIDPAIEKIFQSYMGYVDAFTNK